MTIKYVCLSDMHLGEEDSLLTNLVTDNMEVDHFSPSPVMTCLVDCIRDLVGKQAKKPTLILNGDILELALSSMEQAAMVFERFIEQIFPEEGEALFDGVIYIPGNHDHHIWELARETNYVEYLKKKKNKVKPGSNLKEPWQVTRLFYDNKYKHSMVYSYFLTSLIRRYPHLTEMNINVAYPNFGVRDKNMTRCVVFSHGHYVENLYYFMTKIFDMTFPERKKPTTIYDIEHENFAWIDFFWSAMARSGNREIENIYEKLQYHSSRQKLMKNFAKGLAHEFDSKYLPGERIEEGIIRKALELFENWYTGTERSKPEQDPSVSPPSGLSNYIESPLYDQISTEAGGRKFNNLTFVFGHTHKPFEKDMSFKVPLTWVNVYNTGGWVVESVEPRPWHGGSMVLVDDKLNVAAVRLYNEKKESDSQMPKVEVKDALHPGQPPNPLYQQLVKKINPSNAPWSTFTNAVESAIAVREENMQSRLEED